MTVNFMIREGLVMLDAVKHDSIPHRDGIVWDGSKSQSIVLASGSHRSRCCECGRSDTHRSIGTGYWCKRLPIDWPYRNIYCCGHCLNILGTRSSYLGLNVLTSVVIVPPHLEYLCDARCRYG